MFSTLFSTHFSGKSILTQAVRHGIKENKYSSGTNEPDENIVLYGGRTITAKQMGFSFWERHKVSIITDVAMGIIALIIVAGFVTGLCLTPSSSGKFWIGIAAVFIGSSGIMGAVCCDNAAYLKNIDHLSNEIARRLGTAKQEAEHATNQEL